MNFVIYFIIVIKLIYVFFDYERLYKNHYRTLYYRTLKITNKKYEITDLTI